MRGPQTPPPEVKGEWDCKPLLDGDGVVTLMTVRPVEALRSASLLLVVGDAGSLLLIACQDDDDHHFHIIIATIPPIEVHLLERLGNGATMAPGISFPVTAVSKSSSIVTGQNFIKLLFLK